MAFCSVLGACTEGAVRASEASYATTPPIVIATETTGSTEPSTTTNPPDPSHAVGLFRVDRATLEPMVGYEPITSGDRISGTLSNNGEWLVLNVWIDTEPDTDVIEVVEVSTGRVVTQLYLTLLHDLRVGDDGSLYYLFETGSVRGWVGRVAPGQSEFEMVVDVFASGLTPWTPMTLLDAGRAGWLGKLDADGGQTGLVVGDLSDGSVEVFALPAVKLGEVDEHDLGDWFAPEIMEPAVVWDMERHRALVVHADDQQVTIVDLTTGEVNDQSWSAGTSLIDGLLAWLITPAHAKGPSYGTKRSAVLSPAGDLLYVATAQADITTDDNGKWSVASIPRGVEVIDTENWKVVSSFDIPASQVSLSPDGIHLVATGVTVTDTLSTTTDDHHDAHIIRTDRHEIVGQVELADFWNHDVQYSADGRYLYLGHLGGAGAITIVELETAEVLDLVTGPAQLTMFGEAGMLSTYLRK